MRGEAGLTKGAQGGAELIGLMHHTHQEQLFAGSAIDHAIGAAGELPQGRVEAVQFFQLRGWERAVGEPQNISLDALAKLCLNGQQIPLGMAGEHQLKRRGCLAHAQGIGPT